MTKKEVAPNNAPIIDNAFRITNLKRSLSLSLSLRRKGDIDFQPSFFIARFQVLFSTAPIIWFRPSKKTDIVETSSYACPVYKTSDRRGILSTTGHSTNFICCIMLATHLDPSHWVERGVAMLTSLDDWIVASIDPESTEFLQILPEAIELLLWFALILICCYRLDVTTGPSSLINRLSVSERSTCKQSYVYGDVVVNRMSIGIGIWKRDQTQNIGVMLKLNAKFVFGSPETWPQHHSTLLPTHR